MHRKVAAALVAALALGVASCGSSEPLTRAELVRRIEVACRQGQQEAQKQARARRSSQGGAASFLTLVLAAQRATVERIRDLDAPDEAKDDFEAFKQGMQERLDLFASVDATAGARLQRAMSAAQAEGEAITRRLQAASASLGVRGCA